MYTQKVKLKCRHSSVGATINGTASLGSSAIDSSMYMHVLHVYACTHIHVYACIHVHFTYVCICYMYMYITGTSDVLDLYDRA